MASAVAARSGCCLALSLADVSSGATSRSSPTPGALQCARSAFFGRSIPAFRASASSRHQRQAPKQGVRAYENGENEEQEEWKNPYEDDEEPYIRERVNEWPDPDFIRDTLDAFPAKAIANVEEARVLYERGYTYVDVRPALELQEVGKVPESVNVPLYTSKRVYDKAVNKKVVKKEKNPDFLKTFQKKFPDKKAKLLIACSDAKTYSMDALEMLDEAGYENLVALSGGYYAWFRVFDHKLGRRRTGEYQEDYTHGADSAGIHASGAGFDKVDKIEQWVPPSY